MSFLDAYTVDDLIRKGAYGVVYTCTHKYTNKKFAVKRSKFVENVYGYVASISNDIMRELSILQKAKGNPYIVQLYEFFIDDPYVYIVMELAKGDVFDMQFGSFIHKKRCMYAVLRGCEFLHSFGIVHRDIKTSNILDFGDGVYKLCDFGLCGNKHDTNNRVQTIWWKSPEIVGNKPYTHKIDCWSIGIIFCDIYTGIYNFRCKNEKELKVRWREFSISSIRGELFPIILNLLRENPDDRFELVDIVNNPWWDDVNDKQVMAYIKPDLYSVRTPVEFGLHPDIYTFLYNLVRVYKERTKLFTIETRIAAVIIMLKLNFPLLERNLHEFINVHLSNYKLVKEIEIDMCKTYLYLW